MTMFAVNETKTQSSLEHTPLKAIENELSEGMALAKCRKCGCMKETLETVAESLKATRFRVENGLEGNLSRWLSEMEPIKYACLGCQYCFPAVAMNLLNEAYPEAAPKDAIGCAFEVKEQHWPRVPGEYKVLCEDGDCPVAISTLGSRDLADSIAALRPQEVCIIGKTETENIGIDKIIKNTITNRAIRFLVLAGPDPKGHLPGQTLISLSANGIDEKMRVIGSKGKRPILRNVTANEVELFRKQVQVVDMIGQEDIGSIVEKIMELPMNHETPPLHTDLSAKPTSQEHVGTQACGCVDCNDDTAVNDIPDVHVIQAKEPSKIQMDTAGYFVVLPIAHRGTILVEHYGYDDRLLQTIEGKDARRLYWTIIENNWVTLLSHAAYLGKELAKAELSLKYGFKYVQDGA